MGINLVREFITDDFKTAVQTVLDQAHHGKETANFEFPLITKAGARIEVLLNATTRRDQARVLQAHRHSQRGTFENRN